ncbi:MAG TPA: carbohydrate-binding protein [Actinospica sp.]|jgi:hypothetical protein|nr:carbohydrate-binding protein [Actinospica sp.]
MSSYRTPTFRAWLSVLVLLALGLALGRAVPVAHADARPPSIINPDYDHSWDDYTVKSSAGFTHPGILQDRTQLNTMRDMVQQGYEPWAGAFASFRKDPYTWLDYTPRGPSVSTVPTGAVYGLVADSNAAYDLTLMWYITGDDRYSAKAIGIIDSWATTMTTPSTDWIRVGTALDKMLAAAEILRYTPSSGWTDAETADVESFAALLLPTVDTSSRFMNQEGYSIAGTLAVAVFDDDATLYATAMDRASVGESTSPLTDVAISKQIWSTGQLQEMGRDQAHADDTLATLSLIAQTSYIQGTGPSGGIDLFSYLDNRLLKGAEYFSTFNLGHSVTWSSTDPSGNAGYYSTIADGGRGQLAYADIVYDHYRWLEHVPDSDMPYLARERQIQLTGSASDDFPAYSAMIFTPIQGRQHVPPVGPPLEESNPTVSSAFDRISGASYTATDGPDFVYYSDSDGTRKMLADVFPNQWAEYDGIDFGTQGADTFVISGGGNSTVPASVDIHLDSLTGEIIGTGYIQPTGWYTTLATTATKLNQTVTGVHSIFLQFHGSSNVYGYQGDVDWFAFAHGSSQAQNAAAAADSATGASTVSNGSGGTAVSLSDGAALGYRDMDFDDGSLQFKTRIASTSTGTLSLRTGSATGPVVATYAIPDTGGTWQTVERSMLPSAIQGRNDVYLTYEGTAALSLDTFTFAPGIAPFQQTEGGSFYDTVSGQARAQQRPDGTSFAVFDHPETTTTLTYEPVNFSSGASTLAFTLASRHGGTITLRLNDPANTPIATVEVPPTGGPGSLRDVDLDLTKLSTQLTGSQMVYFDFTGVDTLASFQLDPLNRDAPQLTGSPAMPDRWFVGQPLTVRMDSFDADGRSVTVRPYALPAGAVYDKASSTVTWTPTAAQVGSQQIRMLADDGTTLRLYTYPVTVSTDATTALNDEVSAVGDTSGYTSRSAAGFASAVADAKAEIASASSTLLQQVGYLDAVDAAAARLRAPIATAADGQIDTLNTATVLTNTISYSGVLNDQQAGLPAFDGDLTTFVDLNLSAGLVTADYGSGSGVYLTQIRAYPRAGQTARLKGALFQGSNDGSNWNTLAQIGSSPVNGWNTFTVSDQSPYRYLRFSSNGHADVAEIEYFGDRIDKSQLEYGLGHAALLDPTAYTASSWQAVAAAVSAGNACDSAADSTQAQIDSAYAAIDSAIAALVAS